jgi:hypothetical protein
MGACAAGGFPCIWGHELTCLPSACNLCLQMLTAQLQQLRGQQAAQAVQQQQAAAAAPQQQQAAAASWPGGAGPSTAVTPAAASVPKGEVIYLIGGYDAAIPGESVEGWLRSVQFYSPRTNSWREGEWVGRVVVGLRVGLGRQNATCRLGGVGYSVLATPPLAHQHQHQPLHYGAHPPVFSRYSTCHCG